MYYMYLDMKKTSAIRYLYKFVIKNKILKKMTYALKSTFGASIFKSKQKR